MNRIMNEIVSDVKALENRKFTEAGDIGFEYGWHNPKFPPEMRSFALSRKKFKMDRNTYLYFLMSGWYEKISGCKAPCNFEVYGDWKKKLRLAGREKYGLNEPEIRRLTYAIQAGTRFKRENRDLKNVLAALNESEI